MDKIQRSRKREFFMCQNMIFDQDISEHAKITYAYLSKCADDKEQSFPSYKKIGEKCSFSRSTAIKAIKELKAIGLLSSENRIFIDEQDKARYTSNLYTIYDEPTNHIGSNSGSSCVTPPPSSSETPPLVADRNHPSVPDNHNKYPMNNTHIINTHSIPQEKEREIDINEILYELETTHTIPYYLSHFPNFMETIIKQLSEWEYKYPKGYQDNFEQSAYNLLIEALTEMATSSKLENYKGATVNTKQVIEKINTVVQHDQCHSLVPFIDQTIDDFIKGTSATEVKAIKKYMKSCIWNSFSTYQVKFNAFFQRTYYQTTN